MGLIAWSGPGITQDVYAALFILSFSYILSQWLKDDGRNPNKLPNPPGPKGIPILGNALQIPLEHPWLKFVEWGKQYGNLVYVEARGQPILILNEVSDAIELLERRAVNYSDRPGMPSNELMNLGWAFGLMSKTTLWRSTRKDFNIGFRPSIVPSYRSIIEEETLRYLRRLLDHSNSPGTPKASTCEDDFVRYETHKLFGMITMRVSYGGDDPVYVAELIDQVDTILDGFTQISIPGRYFVNIFPWMRFIPSWFPGAGWKRHFKKISKVCQRMLDEPFDKAIMRKNEAQGLKQEEQDPNRFVDVATQLIGKLPPVSDAEYKSLERISKGAILNAYIGGADTTSGSAQALLYVLGNHPEIQARLQAEIESFVGKHRLPTPQDCPNMPYLQSLVKEISRWHNVTPTALAHLSREDDEYKGYFIPKGTFVVPNVWGMLHDPEVFEDPMEFRPERYLKDGELAPPGFILEPDVVAFGFGTRKCPGRHFNKETLIFWAAAFLSVFKVLPPRDEDGNVLPMAKYDVGSGLISKPVPFRCEIVPRSSAHAALLS